MIKCITIDDEPLALKQMAAYINKTPFLQLEGEFESAIDAISFLNDKTISLMFVDINMPDLSGMDFVKSLKNPPKVIFTTAYPDFALEGYRVDAIDYLLKPISYVAFLEAANKAATWFAYQNQHNDKRHEDKYIFVKSEYKIVKVNFDDILYAESMREYVRIFVKNDKPIMSLTTMKNFEQSLPNDIFMRVHRSYIVNLNNITTIERNRILYGDKRVPVSDQYTDKFNSYVKEKFLKS